MLAVPIEISLREEGLAFDFLNEYEIMQILLYGGLVVQGNAGGLYFVIPGYINQIDSFGNFISGCCYEEDSRIRKNGDGFVTSLDIILTIKFFIETDEPLFRKEIMSHARASSHRIIHTSRPQARESITVPFSAISVSPANSKALPDGIGLLRKCYRLP